MQDVLDNFDDINGPGNNAYLYYDTVAEQFEVVPWDYNLVFGARPTGGGGDMGGDFPGGDGGGDRPEPPEGFDPGQMPTPPTGTPTDTGDGTVNSRGARRRTGPRWRRPTRWRRRRLPGRRYEPREPARRPIPGQRGVERPRVEAKLAGLQAGLLDSGTAAAVLDEWSSIVADSGLVDQPTIDTESSAIAAYFG